MKGSRLPFAFDLASGTTGSSIASFSLPSAAAPAIAFSCVFGFATVATIPTFGSTILPGTTRRTVPAPRFATPVRGGGAGCALTDLLECTAVPLAVAALVAFEAAGGAPKASFDAAVARLFTPFIVLRVFWIMLGFWARAKPPASAQTRIVVVVVIMTGIAGFIFIPSFLFLHRRRGLAVRSRIQIVAEI